MKGFRTSCSFSFPELSCRKGRLLQGAVRRTEAGAALSLPLHPSGRHLEPPPRRSRRRRRRVPLEGLSHRRAGPLEDDAASPARVHPPLSSARAAQRLPPHPPLRALRQRQPRREYRDGPRAASAPTRPPPIRNSSRMSRPRRRARCPAHARVAAPAWSSSRRSRAAASRGGGRRRPRTTHHEPDRLRAPPLSRALARRRRRSLSAKPRQSTIRPPLDTPHAVTEIPIARFRYPFRNLSRPPGPSFAPTIIIGAKIKSP